MIHEEALPTWIPVLFGMVTPVFFCITVTLTRFVCREQYGICFDGAKIVITSMIIMQALVIIAAIIYWNSELGHHIGKFDLH